MAGTSALRLSQRRHERPRRFEARDRALGRAEIPTGQRVPWVGRIDSVPEGARGEVHKQVRAALADRIHAVARNPRVPGWQVTFAGPLIPKVNMHARRPGIVRVRCRLRHLIRRHWDVRKLSAKRVQGALKVVSAMRAWREP